MFKMSEPKPEITSNMEPASAAALQSETNSESSEKAVNVEKNLPEEADLSAREIPQTSSLPVSLIPNPPRKSELSPGKKSNLTLSRDGSWNDRPTDSSPASMPNRSPCSDRASFKSNKLEDTRLARHHTSNETVCSQITNFRVWEYILSIVKHGSVMSHLGSGSAFVSEGKAMRGHWLGRFDCMISLMAASVGIGNFTHFPAKAHKHGAGTFLFPFIFVTCLVGVPIFYMEACLGQYSNYGAVMGWHMVPLFKGVGAGIGLTAAVMSVYYAVFVVYPIFYFGCSFKTPLPWAHCDNPWNSDGNYAGNRSKTVLSGAI
ncbi:uncharacterized protein [Littorina saxatilis]|uniref:uncharacterized protein n=1 Tax=Littorina saxatilis TaxID=31220 RepID=UPI0038B53030